MVRTFDIEFHCCAFLAGLMEWAQMVVTPEQNTRLGLIKSAQTESDSLDGLTNWSRAGQPFTSTSSKRGHVHVFCIFHSLGG